MTALAGGNGFIHGAFATAIAVPAGAQVSIAIGDIETTWL
jgi:hypothetical protein